MPVGTWGLPLPVGIRHFAKLALATQQMGCLAIVGRQMAWLSSLFHAWHPRQLKMSPTQLRINLRPRVLI